MKKETRLKLENVIRRLIKEESIAQTESEKQFTIFYKDGSKVKKFLPYSEIKKIISQNLSKIKSVEDESGQLVWAWAGSSEFK